MRVYLFAGIGLLLMAVSSLVQATSDPYFTLMKITPSSKSCSLEQTGDISETCVINVAWKTYQSGDLIDPVGPGIMVSSQTNGTSTADRTLIVNGVTILIYGIDNEGYLNHNANITYGEPISYELLGTEDPDSFKGTLTATFGEYTPRFTSSTETHNTLEGDFNGDGSADAYYQPKLKEVVGGLLPISTTDFYDFNNYHREWSGAHPDIPEITDWSEETYGAFSANLNDSPGDELLLLGKKKIILLHGDIITPIVIYPEIRNAIVSWDSSGVASINSFDLDVDPDNFSIQFADLDGDGIDEIFLQNNSSGGTSYIVDGSGVVVQTLTNGYLGIDWSTNSQIGFYDFNGDGRLDIQIRDSDGNIFVIYASASGTYDTTPVELTDGWSDSTAVTIPDATPVSPDVTDVLGLEGYSIPGSGGVSGGQASYSIPIELPPGRNKVAPSVSLNYNSQGGNGVVGVGWSLNASQSISRCSSTYVQDGLSRSVQFEATDKLCLGGERLITVSGSYGADGAIYRTEMDSFVKVEQVGSYNSSTSFFNVYYGDGQVLKFGGTTDSTAIASGTLPHQWKLSQLSKTSGNNVIDYEYDDSVTGENLLKEIYYTRNNTSKSVDTVNDRRVSFVYEARTDTDQSWIGNKKLNSTRRLSQINTYVGAGAASNYRLGYQSSSASQRSLLSSVIRCEDENTPANQCSSASSFEWFDQASTFLPESTPLDASQYLHLYTPSGDKNGDGSVDWNGYWVNAEGDFTANNLESVDNCYFNRLSGSKTCHNADINLDGLGDAVQINKSTYVVETGVSNGTSLTWTETSIDVDNLLSSITYLGDLNGDAYPDLMVNHYSYSNDSSDIYFYPHSQNVNDPYSIVNRQLIQSIPVHYLPGVGYKERDGFSTVGDMNGDGTVDFVYSRGAGKDSKYGLQPYQLIFTKPKADGFLDITPSNLNLEANSHYSVGGRTWTRFQIYADINGDNLQDWLGFYKPDLNGNKLFVRYNNAGTFSAPVETGMTIPTRVFLYSEDLSANGNGEVVEGVVAKYGGSYRAMDVDGDGKDEIIYPGSMVRSACYNVRLYNNSFKEVCGGSIYGTHLEQSGSGIFSSIDERWDFSIYQYNIARFENGAFTIDNNVTLYGAATHTSVTDAFGNGLTDIVFSYGCGTAGCRYTGNEINGLTAGKINVVRNFGSGSGQTKFDYQPIDYLHTATNGLGSTQEWAYRPLSTSENSTGRSFYETDHANTEEGYFHFTSSMYTVKSYFSDNGIGGTNTTEYAYKGAMYHAQGYGFTGFNEMFEKQVESNKTTQSIFSQVFPKVGLLTEQITQVDGVTVNSLTNNWLDNPQHNIANIYHNFLNESDVYTYGTDGLEIAHSTTKVESADVDAWGNTEISTQTIDNGFSTIEQKTVSDFTNDDGNDWWIGKLDKTVQTMTTVSGTVLRDSYSSLDPVKEIQTDYTWHTPSRQVEKIQVTPRQGSPLQADGIASEVNTLFNDYGLPTTVTTSAKNDTSETRSVTSKYSKNGTSESLDGYFVYQVTNDLDQESTGHTNPENGSVKKSIDINGLETNYLYDAVWRPVQVTPPSGVGPISKTRYQDCAAGCGEITGNNSSDIKYKVTTYTAGTPETNEYKDAFGRTLFVRTEGFDGSYIYVRTQYDGLGRKTFDSIPSFNDLESKGTSYLAYDGLSRLTSKSIDQPHAQTMDVTYTYSQHLTTITANNLEMYRTHSGNGQLIKTEDALNGVTDYAYDNMGNPIILQDANGHAIQATYNALKQKNYVIDPNMGNKDFTYTQFGEIYTEKDANNATYRYEYDDIGRLTQRFLNDDLEASFVFDLALQGATIDYCEGAITSETREDLTSGENFSKTYAYDDQCRPSSVTTTIDGVNYTSEMKYDDFYGRVKGTKTITGLLIENIYNPRGYLTKVQNAASGYKYRENMLMDARLQLTSVLKANGVLSETLDYAPESGQMFEVTAEAVSIGDQRHRIEYTYDSYGNLDTQTAENMVGNDVVVSTEDYDYDDLHRLIWSSSNIGGAVDSIDYDYDAVGNITIKSDFSTDFTYGDANRTNGNAGPNAVRQVVKTAENGGATETYTYDNNGNMLNGDNRELTYNAFNKPLTILKNGIESRFSYGSSQMRYKQVKSGISGGDEKTVYVDKAYEEITHNGVTTKRQYIGDAIINETIGGANSGFKIGFVHRDRLGSTVTISDQKGDVVDNKSFDPFGKVRKGTFERIDPMNFATLSVLREIEGFDKTTDRGFTDHEHLDDAQLIHMNGRVYDYNLGRFLSVDPFIQDPGNSQSMNPYSYILNNPLAGTDPSGYTSEMVKKDFEYKIRKTGSRIVRKGKVTVTGTSDGKGGASFNVSGGNGAPIGKMVGAIAAKVSGANSSASSSSIGGLESRNQKSSSTSQKTSLSNNDVVNQSITELDNDPNLQAAIAQQNSDLPSARLVADNGVNVYESLQNTLDYIAAPFRSLMRDSGGLSQETPENRELVREVIKQQFRTSVEVVAYPLAGEALGAGAVLYRGIGPLKQWVRVGPSYSKAAGQKINMSIRWGASPIGNGKYIKQIPSSTMQQFNQWLRGKKLPGKGWRTQDTGHLHIKK